MHKDGPPTDAPRPSDIAVGDVLIVCESRLPGAGLVSRATGTLTATVVEKTWHVTEDRYQLKTDMGLLTLFGRDRAVRLIRPEVW